MAEIMFDYKGNPIPRFIVENLRKSKTESEKYPKREIKCPICGIHLCDVYGNSPDVFISVKCQKCKSGDLPLSMAYFRTLKGKK